MLLSIALDVVDRVQAHRGVDVTVRERKVEQARPDVVSPTSELQARLVECALRETDAPQLREANRILEVPRVLNRPGAGVEDELAALGEKLAYLAPARGDIRGRAGTQVLPELCVAVDRLGIGLPACPLVEVANLILDAWHGATLAPPPGAVRGTTIRRCRGAPNERPAARIDRHAVAQPGGNDRPDTAVGSRAELSEHRAHRGRRRLDRRDARDPARSGSRLERVLVVGA